MTDWIGEADAVLMAWYPGEEGGGAVADILWGEASPSGRLPITFPRAVGEFRSSITTSRRGGSTAISTCRGSRSSRSASV